VTVNRAALRKLVEGWKPGMTVEIRVDVLQALLVELDKMDEAAERQLVQLVALAREIKADVARVEEALREGRAARPPEDPCS
jgi:hypothetical protein